MATEDMPGYGDFLMQRGKDRDRRLWYVRYPVPNDLQDRFGKRLIRPLKTTDIKEAKKKRHAVIAELESMFVAARAGSLTLTVIEQEASALYDARLALYAAKPDSFFNDGDGIPSEADGGLLALSDWAEHGVPEMGMTEAANAILLSRGLAMDAQGRSELCKALYNAETYALRQAMTVRDGIIPERPAFFSTKSLDRVTFKVITPARPAPRKGKAPKISEAGKGYIAENTRDPAASWAPKTVMTNELVLRRFAEHMGDAPLDTVTSEDAAAFIDRIASLSKRYVRNPKARNMSLAQLEKHYAAKDGDVRLSNTTLNGHANVLVGLWKWAKKPYGLTGDNPFSGLQRKKPKGTGYEAYTIDELNLLLGGKRFDASRDERIKPQKHGIPSSLPWLILIALFSGMRAAEIAGLRTSDIQEKDGVTFFQLEPHETRRIKSEAGERKVPVHSELVTLGLLEYVEFVRGQGHKMLFPGFKKNKKRDSISHTFSNRFTEYRRDCKITRDRLTFHSLRDNFTGSLDESGVHMADVAAVVGHHRGFTFDVYSKKGPGLKRLQEIVEMARYEGLNLKRLK